MSVWDGFFQTQTGFHVSSVPPKQHFVGETVCSSYDPREGQTDCDLGINTSYLRLRSMDQSHGCLCWWRNSKSWGHRAPSCDHTSYACGHSYESCLSLLKICIMADMSYDRHCWTSIAESRLLQALGWMFRDSLQYIKISSRAFQVALVVKNPPANNAGDMRDMGSVPELGRCPAEGHGNSFQYSCLENPLDKGTWPATSIGSQRVRHNRSDLAQHGTQNMQWNSMYQTLTLYFFTWKLCLGKETSSLSWRWTHSECSSTVVTFMEHLLYFRKL